MHSPLIYLLLTLCYLIIPHSSSTLDTRSPPLCRRLAKRGAGMSCHSNKTKITLGTLGSVGVITRYVDLHQFTNAREFRDYLYKKRVVPSNLHMGFWFQGRLLTSQFDAQVTMQDLTDNYENTHFLLMQSDLFVQLQINRDPCEMKWARKRKPCRVYQMDDDREPLLKEPTIQPSLLISSVYGVDVDTQVLDSPDLPFIRKGIFIDLYEAYSVYRLHRYLMRKEFINEYYALLDSHQVAILDQTKARFMPLEQVYQDFYRPHKLIIATPLI